MEHIVDLLRRHGVTEIVATLHYLADEIESYFGDGSSLRRLDAVVRGRGHAARHGRRRQAGRSHCSATSRS
jgi:NDP-sugar pyrophosphorylase family protein